MQRHSEYGERIIKELTPVFEDDFKSVCRDVCKYHHEKWDGNGYPDGLAGDEIPISAQIVSMADILDALTHKRSYKKAFTLEKSFKLIKNGECGAFSEKMFKILDTSIEEVNSSLENE